VRVFAKQRRALALDLVLIARIAGIFEVWVILDIAQETPPWRELQWQVGLLMGTSLWVRESW